MLKSFTEKIENLFLFLEYDPNPLLSLSKRKQRPHQGQDALPHTDQSEATTNYFSFHQNEKILKQALNSKDAHK